MRLQYTDSDRCYMLSERAGVPYLHFAGWEPFSHFLVHGISTRAGGVSEGCFASMNLSYHRGDNPLHVDENFRRMLGALSLSPKRLVCSQQTHSSNVMVVGPEDIMPAAKLLTAQRDCGGSELNGEYTFSCDKADGGEDTFVHARPDAADGEGASVHARPDAEPVPHFRQLLSEPPHRQIDALVCAEPGIALVASFADCVPLLLVDPERRVIALAHAGWRGTVAGIALKTIEVMRSRFGSLPGQLHCAIGPSICADCFEVGDEVAAQFIRAADDMFSAANRQKLISRKHGRFHIDLWEANRSLMLKAGVLAEHIITGNLCTRCNHTALFSHRAMGSERGNMCVFMGLQ